MTILLVHEYDYDKLDDVKWADDMARYIRDGLTEVPALRVFRLEETGAGEVDIADITDECNDQLERASGACSPLPLVRTRSYLPERLGGAL
jgi:hypothetical protein